MGDSESCSALPVKPKLRIKTITPNGGSYYLHKFIFHLLLKSGSLLLFCAIQLKTVNQMALGK
jgi:hypothetical protein